MEHFITVSGVEVQRLQHVGHHYGPRVTLGALLRPPETGSIRLMHVLCVERFGAAGFSCSIWLE